MLFWDLLVDAVIYLGGKADRKNDKYDANKGAVK